MHIAIQVGHGLNSVTPTIAVHSAKQTFTDVEKLGQAVRGNGRLYKEKPQIAGVSL